MKSSPSSSWNQWSTTSNYARDFYESWKWHGTEDFMLRFRESVAWIEWNPEMFPRKYRQFRRAIIRRSYFGIYYVIESEVTTVVAVLDMRRDPRTIQDTLKRRK